MLEPATLTVVKHLLTKATIEWMASGVFLDTGERSQSWWEYWKKCRDVREAGLSTRIVKRPEAGPTAASGAVLRGMLRACASDLGRPFVVAEAHFKYNKDEGEQELNYWEVNFPNDKRLEPVVAHLMLASRPIKSNQKGHSASDGPLPMCGHVVPAQSRNVFRITDAKLFDMWLDRCKTDPLFQKALGNLPEKVT